MQGPIYAGNFLLLVVVDSINICNDEDDDVDVLVVLMVLTCGKSAVNICRARVAETGELEETPILLEVLPGTIQYITDLIFATQIFLPTNLEQKWHKFQ